LNILRRVSLARLLLLGGLVVALAISATAIASALDEGPAPAPKPLADAVHDALAAQPVQGVSANVQLTDHLLEGANLASGGGSGGLTSSPLIAGGSGRLWIDKGHARLELQSEAGDTQVLFDGHTLQVYDAATNTLYRYTRPAHEAPAGEPGAQPQPAPDTQGPPSIAKIEEAISKLNRHLDVSEARPGDVAGRPAYTVRVSPREGGSLLGGAELSWDADNGVPLRTAIYSSASSAPVVELAMSEVSFGPIESSVFAFTPPSGAKVDEVRFGEGHVGTGATGAQGSTPTLTTHGHGPATIAVLESKSSGETSGGGRSEDLPNVTINGTSASELKTELGTLLEFERAGVRYVVAGAVPPGAVEEIARGL
jgi:outer membrane lipoprotein-sorting protein